MARVRDVIQRDTRANQPLATAVDVGTLFYVTDESTTERSNGTIWETYADAGSGGSVGDLLDFIAAYKTSDESIDTSTVLQDDDDLLFDVGANEIWQFDIALIVISASNTPDIKTAFTVPTSCVLDYGSQGLVVGSTGNDGSYRAVTRLNDPTNALSMAAVSFQYTINLKGLVRNDANAGTIQLQWAQNTSNATATVVKAGSYLMARRVL